MIRGVQKTLYLILAFFIGLFIASSFFIRAKYNYFVYGDTPVLEKQQLGLFILVIAVVLALSVILYKMCLKLNKYSWKIVIPATLLFSFVIQNGGSSPGMNGGTRRNGSQGTDGVSRQSGR